MSVTTCVKLQLAYLPYKRRDLILDDESIDLFVPPLEGSTETTEDTLKGEKKTRKHGLLNWLKLRVCAIWLVEIFHPFLRCLDFGVMVLYEIYVWVGGCVGFGVVGEGSGVGVVWEGVIRIDV